MTIELVRARHWLKQVIEFGKALPEAREHARTLLAATGEDDVLDDPRPTDMAELAKLVAKELRLKGFFVAAVQQSIIVPRLKGTLERGYGLSMHHYSLYGSQFDNLGPKAIAALIQAEETKRAQEWAGDK